ncbi:MULTISPECIES: hypothetical protein [unclassified Gilliamella]|uniref:hypothetical protein n=1 Tax=unclassified Gilliamella TaxID=2685620 RepID=UPI001C1F42DA|nr:MULTISPECIES: hypothetical protein [unclassified Gilliamella]
MHPDDLLIQELIEKLDDVRKFFINPLDHDAIQLFLHPCGKVDVWGVYQLVEKFLYLREENNGKNKIKKVLEVIVLGTGLLK